MFTLCRLVSVVYSGDATTAKIQAFMYTDKHGEVCPAGWQPGADTIIPDPKVPSKSTIFTYNDCDQKCPGEACLLQEAGRAVKMVPLGGHHGCEVLFNNVCDQFRVTKQHLFSSSSIRIEDSSYQMHLKGLYLSSLI